VKKTGSLNRAFVILVLLVVLPALFYSAYELNAISASEELLAALYQRQLDVVLFSLNQYSWDVVSTWAASIAVVTIEHAQEGRIRLQSALAPLLESRPGLLAVFGADSTGRDVWILHGSADRSRLTETEIARGLAAQENRLAALLDYRRQQYRKLEPMVVGDTTHGHLALLFAADDGAGKGAIAGMVIEEERFIADVLSIKLREAAGDEFVLTVLPQRGGEPLFTTDRSARAAAAQVKELWLFPSYVLGIAMRGTTVGDLVHTRATRSFVLILLLDIVLLAGVWVVYRNMKAELEYVRLKADFVSTVSHELRTPLALIRMYGETLAMGRLTEEGARQDYYATIVRESERLTRLVNNILHFSRLEGGKQEYHVQPLDLNQTVRSLIGTYRVGWEAGGIRIRETLREPLPAVLADGEAVAEAVLNLVENAVKYSPDDKEILITTGVEGHAVFVAVEDHGVGIAPEHHAKIFDTFYRVDTPLARNAGGSGLGLSVVKSIMDAHKGRVEVASVPGEGSTFRLLFRSVQR
jgi:two-component system phosphate regulon sensor histidine kinase PhoR